jgi:hypothetical protein
VQRMTNREGLVIGFVYKREPGKFMTIGRKWVNRTSKKTVETTHIHMQYMVHLLKRSLRKLLLLQLRGGVYVGRPM